MRRLRASGCLVALQVRRAVLMSWETLYRYTGPIDPDYGGAPTSISVWRDNLGGLVLGIDAGDGEQVLAVPISDSVAEDLAMTLLGEGN